jgi:hypothetical protein
VRALRSAADLLAAYVVAHNDGVRSGRFGYFLALFDAAASMRFHGRLRSVGTFRGRAAIRAALRTGAPTETLVLRRLHVRSGRAAEATYAWSERPGRAAGRLILRARRGLVARVDVHAT